MIIDFKQSERAGFQFYATGLPTYNTYNTYNTDNIYNTYNTYNTNLIYPIYSMTLATTPTPFTRCPHPPRVFLRRGALQAAPTVVIALAFCLLAACAPAHTVSLEALELAERGASANTEWQPALQSVNGVTMALVPAGCFQMGTVCG